MTRLKEQVNETPPAEMMWRNAWRARLEIAGLTALAGAAVFFVATSWRKWPDPLMDFGQTLYNAWQLSEGAVLYRDVGCLYGPLSQYFNAGIFRIFGPGLIVLAIANLTVFAAISISIYILFRRAWGVLAAWLSTLIFISVFGFSQFVDAGNYNYAAPYANETIHGMLICVLLCRGLCGWVGKPSAARSFLCGLLLGATIVLKPEFILAAVVITSLAALIRWRSHGLPPTVASSCWAIAVLLPSALFTIYFAQFLPWSRAISASSQAWFNVFNSSFNRSPLAIRLLGLDHPWFHLVEGLLATALAGAVILALVGTMLLIERKLPNWLRLSSAMILVLIFGWLGCFVINWIEVGRCLFGLALIYFLVSIGFFLRNGKRSAPDFGVRILRLLIAGLAVGLMARMFLNPRIYHYGYYQAAMAALLVPSFMIGELAAWLEGGWRVQAVAIAATFALVLPGIAQLATRSEHAWALKTEAVAEGRDLFYCFPAEMDSIGDVVKTVVAVLREKAGGETLTVLPEGESINYFTRLRNPVPHACFYKGAMETQTEAELVTDLQQQSPYWIVIISRDLIGWGIERYGEKGGSGEEVLRWVEQNYKQVASLGGDPLDYRERGAIVLRKYSR
ncbi:MAG: hypothetical protein QOE81_190 [Verrucomicrobiota bacterium]|jgi:hypothetical protein